MCTIVGYEISTFNLTTSRLLLSKFCNCLEISRDIPLPLVHMYGNCHYFLWLNYSQSSKLQTTLLVLVSKHYRAV